MVQLVYMLDYFILYRGKELGHKYQQIIQEGSYCGRFLALAAGRKRVVRLVASLTGFSPDDLVVVGRVVGMQPYHPLKNGGKAARPIPGKPHYFRDGARPCIQGEHIKSLTFDDATEVGMNADAVFRLDDPGRS